MIRGAIIAISDEDAGPHIRSCPISEMHQRLRKLGVCGSALRFYTGHHREFDIAGWLVLFSSKEHESRLPITAPGCHYMMLTIDELNACCTINSDDV